jgi:hypothetical protein
VTDLTTAINNFERRMAVSPVDRMVLLSDEYLQLKGALIHTVDELHELTARIVAMEPREAVK